LLQVQAEFVRTRHAAALRLWRKRVTSFAWVNHRRAARQQKQAGIGAAMNYASYRR
jgi:hypothetical protein